MVQDKPARGGAARGAAHDSHGMPVRLATEAGRADLVADLTSGRPLGGVSFAHLRRAAASPLRAVREGGRRRLRGSAL